MVANWPDGPPPPLAGAARWPGPSRTRPTSSASTGSATAAGSTTRATAASSIPFGEVLADGAGDGETILVADVDPAVVATTSAERFPFLADRR